MFSAVLVTCDKWPPTLTEELPPLASENRANECTGEWHDKKRNMYTEKWLNIQSSNTARRTKSEGLQTLAQRQKKGEKPDHVYVLGDIYTCHTYCCYAYHFLRVLVALY
jgi:hypothetical protein